MENTIVHPTTFLRVPLPEDVVAVYDKQATAHNRPLEAELSERLKQFAHVDSTKPIVLNDMQRQHLDKLLGRNLATADVLVAAVGRALSVQVDGVEVPITPYLLDRLKTRCIGMDFDKFVAMTIRRLLEEYVGVR